jgi:hypothetical protein
MMDPDSGAFEPWGASSTAPMVVVGIEIVGSVGSPASEPSALETPTPPTRTNPIVMATERLIMFASLADHNLSNPRKSPHKNRQEMCKKRFLTRLFQERHTLTT